jgi:hypothetical protein
VDWKEYLNPGTKRRAIKELQTPNLAISYTSSFANDCEGEVRVYVAPKDDPSTVELLRVKRHEIAGLSESIASELRSIDDLQRNVVQDNIRSKIEARIRVYEEQRNRLIKAITLLQQVDGEYSPRKEQIDLCLRIADKLESNKPVVVEFRNFYRELPGIIGRQQSELEPRLVDGLFGGYLLDPVQLVCGGAHGRSYERRQIAQHLQTGGSCPDCRKTGTLSPLSPLAIEVGDIIDNIFTQTLSAEKLFPGVAGKLPQEEKRD